MLKKIAVVSSEPKIIKLGIELISKILNAVNLKLMSVTQ